MKFRLFATLLVLLVLFALHALTTGADEPMTDEIPAGLSH